MARSSKPGRVLIRRLAWGAGTLFVLWCAVEGGEYGSSDLLTQREEKAQLESDLALLRDTVATLDATLKRVSTDDFTLERIAREEHGLVKGEKELLYWIDDPEAKARADSVRAAADSGQSSS
ncbi:FtsB family cell division protein [Gemmatimonas sp.]|uniref:FtsB family cell division protein n=1 Tax=Gemmatimonas sp. TaxID=1962908 RepID=UPI003DA416AE